MEASPVPGTDEDGPLRCPCCGSPEVVPTSRGWSDLFALILFRGMARCGTCQDRFSTRVRLSTDGEPVPGVRVRGKPHVRAGVDLPERILAGKS